MPITFVVDPWSPYVYGTPVDDTITFTQNGLKPFASVIAVVAKKGVDETYWNGTAFVSYADMGFPDSYGEPPVGSIVATMPHLRQWHAVIPWSVIGGGRFLVRFHQRAGNSTIGFAFHYTCHTCDRFIEGPKSPNPEGVTVDSSFGSTDALRVTTVTGQGIAGAKVEARVFHTDDTLYFTRGLATTDADGRWAFDRVLEPETEHALRFTKNGYTFPTSTITTGG